MDKHRKPKVGLFFLACDRFLEMGNGTSGGTYQARVQQQAKQIIEDLSSRFKIYNDTLILNSQQVQSSIACFVQNDVDMILIVFLSWSQDAALIRLLRDMPLFPMVLYCPVKEQIAPSSGVSEEQLVEFLASGGLVGTLEASGSFVRQRKKVQVLVGTPKETMDQLTSFAIAAKATKFARNAKFGLMSGYNELMWSTYVNPYQFFVNAGPEIKFLTYNAYAEAISKISDAEAEAYCTELSQKYTMEKDVDQKLFIESARASLGLYVMAQALGLDALAINDVDIELLKLIGLRPGFYCEGWNEDVSVVVPEADLGAAFVSFILKIMSESNVNFVEPFYVDKKRNLFAVGHAGPHDHTGEINRPFVKIATDVRFCKQPIRYAGAPFAWLRIPPGKKTLAHFSENNGSYKIVCFEAESIEGSHIFPSFSHGEFVPRIPVNELFEKIINKGINQHFAVVNKDVSSELEFFAKINGFEYHEIN